MTSQGAVAPRLGRLVATAVMTYTVLWALIEIETNGSHVSALIGLGLLCCAFLLALTASRRSLVRSIAAVASATVGVVVEVSARHGVLGTPQLWLTCAVASVSLLLLWRGQHILAWALMGLSAAVICTAGGLQELQDLGILTTALVLGVIAAAGRVLGWYAEQMRKYAESERDSLEWRIAQDVYQQAHQQRIEQTGRLASPMLQQIVALDGSLGSADRAECRLLHQSIRDETRGRYLLNDAVREQIKTHRRRGAIVQILDDGQLGVVQPEALTGILDEVASLLTGLSSDRIIVRSGSDQGSHVITVVATSADPVAVALGMDDDDQVDLHRRLEVCAQLESR